MALVFTDPHRRYVYPDKPPAEAPGLRCLGDQLREQARREGRLGARMVGRPGADLPSVVETWAERKARRAAERAALQPAPDKSRAKTHRAPRLTTEARKPATTAPRKDTRTTAHDRPGRLRPRVTPRARKPAPKGPPAKSTRQTRRRWSAR